MAWNPMGFVNGRPENPFVDLPHLHNMDGITKSSPSVEACSAINSKNPDHVIWSVSLNGPPGQGAWGTILFPFRVAPWTSFASICTLIKMEISNGFVLGVECGLYCEHSLLHSGSAYRPFGFRKYRGSILIQVRTILEWFDNFGPLLVFFLPSLS